ncbi:hypothetical protein ASG43_13520 [Aureimonas sp. Leaf454]|uniref:hypothetical protein n=1 Tax=Aureimonas sp. Leaf454 TaxID=1736381 RepID=UPI0006FCDCEB|nr:hypothetical protein [Aureimonas sp. Leaf454]KQT44370.1 hypothetical protein ASG43_13520 [Aureimonas sp. Leaf454]
MKELDTNKGRSVTNGIAEARTGLFRATLLFGSIAAALSLIIVPAADRHAHQVADERASLDQTVTGTNKPTIDRYTLRRSVLRPSQEPCLLFPDGTQRGAC